MPNPPENPVVPGVPTSRRGLAVAALLESARELLVARFVLARALDKLTTEDVLAVLDEVDETIESARRAAAPKKTTLRDEN